MTLLSCLLWTWTVQRFILQLVSLLRRIVKCTEVLFFFNYTLTIKILSKLRPKQRIFCQTCPASLSIWTHATRHRIKSAKVLLDAGVSVLAVHIWSVTVTFNDLYISLRLNIIVSAWSQVSSTFSKLPYRGCINRPWIVWLLIALVIIDLFYWAHWVLTLTVWRKLSPHYAAVWVKVWFTRIVNDNMTTSTFSVVQLLSDICICVLRFRVLHLWWLILFI